VKREKGKVKIENRMDAKIIFFMIYFFEINLLGFKNLTGLIIK